MSTKNPATATWTKWIKNPAFEHVKLDVKPFDGKRPAKRKSKRAAKGRADKEAS